MERKDKHARICNTSALLQVKKRDSNSCLRDVFGREYSLWNDIFRLSDNWIKSSKGMNWEEKKKE